MQSKKRACFTASLKRENVSVATNRMFPVGTLRYYEAVLVRGLDPDALTLQSVLPPPWMDFLPQSPRLEAGALWLLPPPPSHSGMSEWPTDTAQLPHVVWTATRCQTDKGPAALGHGALLVPCDGPKVTEPTHLPPD